MQQATKRVAVLAAPRRRRPQRYRGRGDGRFQRPVQARGNSFLVDEEKGISRTDGSLIGTWQTTSFKTIAEGLTQTAGVSAPPYEYAGAGTELFTGCHDRNGNRRCEASEKGTLKLTYTYWGTFDPTTGALIKGQCQHPIIGGTGAFKQARGVVYMSDRPTASGRHHCLLGHARLRRRGRTNAFQRRQPERVRREQLTVVPPAKGDHPSPGGESLIAARPSASSPGVLAVNPTSVLRAGMGASPRR